MGLLRQCRGFQRCTGKSPFKIRGLLNKAWKYMLKNEVVGVLRGKGVC